MVQSQTDKQELTRQRVRQAQDRIDEGRNAAKELVESEFNRRE